MKKIMILTICLCFVLLLSSCTIGHIKDENGDDKSLCSLTDEDILENVSSYTQTAAITSNVGDRVVYKANKFSGVTTIKKIPYAVGEKMIIRSSIDVKEGNLRVVLIQNDKIILDIPLGENQTTIIEDSRRDYKIKIAGESAEFDLELEYEIIEMAE